MLKTEMRNPRTMGIEKMESAEIVRTINEENRRVTEAIDAATEDIARAVDAITYSIGNGGPVSFLGLAVPHISRFVCRTDDFRTLFPTTIFFGATVAMLCNLACTAFTDQIIPLSAVTPLVGAPVVLYMFFRKR